MYNDLFNIGPFTVHTYGLMTAIGILAAFFYAERAAGRKKQDPESIFGLVIACLIFGYLGSKILYLLTILPGLIEDPSQLRDCISSGWVVYGGILGGLVGGLIYCSGKKLPCWKYLDIGLPALALAQGFGRIGCFFAGCCYGVETDSPFSIVFTNSLYAPNHVHLLPIQLISAAIDFAIFFILYSLDRRKHIPGSVGALYLVIYSAARFTVEFWRGDLVRGAVGPLSTSQFIAIFTFAIGVFLFAVRLKGGREEEDA